MKEEYISNSAEETEKIGKDFANMLNPGDVVCLYGDLGAGKTMFTQGVAKGLGIESRIISPTFSLVRQHEINVKSQNSKVKNTIQNLKVLYHIDLYRLENIDEVESIGLKEILSDDQAVTFIEWADKAMEILPQKKVQVHIKLLENERRKITITRL